VRSAVGIVIFGTVVLGTVTGAGGPPPPVEAELGPDTAGFPAPVVKFTSTSSVPESAVVTKPPTLGLEICQSANTIGRSTSAKMPLVVRSVVIEKRTERVTPWRLRSPDAEYVFLDPTGATVPNEMDPLSFNVEVGNCATSMIRPSNCAFRWLWSLTTLAMSTLKVPAVTRSPAMVIDPHIFDVRPTAVACCPMSTSETR